MRSIKLPTLYHLKPFVLLMFALDHPEQINYPEISAAVERKAETIFQK